MLELFTRHGGFDLKLAALGDLDVDQHHTVEDVGIALGEAFDRALGDRRGILRAGYFVMPMDETLGLAAVDFGGRAAAVVDTKVRATRVGDLQVELVPDFFEGFARGARANVHARVLYGRSSHHKIEALFKAFARALRVACSRDRRLGRMLPSTKGTSMIAIVDYGAGNLNSVKKAFDYLGAEVMVTDQPETVAAADKIVLPGVGHFSSLQALNRTGLREALLQGASAGKPFLGICLGMQWLFEGSEECPELAGAGIFRRQMPAVSVLREIAARRMEFSGGSRRLAVAARRRTGLICLLHALFPCAGGCRNDGS